MSLGGVVLGVWGNDMAASVLAKIVRLRGSVLVVMDVLASVVNVEVKEGMSGTGTDGIIYSREDGPETQRLFAFVDSSSEE